MTPEPIGGVPVLAIAPACVTEARRALVSDDILGPVVDDAFVTRLLLIARALPVGLDALQREPELFGRTRLMAPVVDSVPQVSAETLRAWARLDDARASLEVRFAAGAPDKLVESNAAVLCRVVFPLVIDEAGDDGGKVSIQRFGQGPMLRR